MARPPSLAEARRHFAEELRMVGHVQDDRVLEAFAAIPRERFVGPGPWRILNLLEGGYWTTPDSDPRWLCHNVLIALDESRGLNTGEPSLWAYHFDKLAIGPGDRVLQIGTGSGYFTAILAELTGPDGRVLGLEVDAPLAAAATENLAPWPQASIRKVDGIVAIDSQFDVIVAFAGATAPPAVWLDALAEGGRALIPLTGAQRWGMLLRVDRTPQGLAARRASGVGIFHCAGARNEHEAEALSRALVDAAGQQALKSLRRDRHDADESCWLHGDGWCLSKRELH
ncbi:MAG: protein-L-isoaspartate O-methyltransferase [Reyranellales bacterium]